MTDHSTVFESLVHLYKSQYKSTGVDESLISCINIYF